MGIFFSKPKEKEEDKKKEQGQSEKKTVQAKNQQQKVILSKSDRLEKGQLLCRVIIEMLGKPKGHLEKTFEDLMGKFLREEKIVFVKKTYSKTKKQGNLFSRFAEIEFWAENLSVLIGLCFDYMPSSVEVLEPENVVFPVHQLTGYLNEMQAKLHHVDMIAKNTQTEKAILASNFIKLMENSIVLTIASGTATAANIAKAIGLKEEGLAKPLQNLLEAKRIKKVGEKYALA